MAEQLENSLETDIRSALPTLVTHIIQSNTSNTYLQEFCDRKKHHERVKYVDEYYHQSKPKFLKELEGRRFDDEKPIIPGTVGLDLYNDACVAFAKQNHYKALRDLNKCICMSTHNPRIMAMCYSNRSAVLFELKKYEEALIDIRRARELNPQMPAPLVEKLETREFIIVEDKLQYPIERSELDCNINFMTTFEVTNANENHTRSKHLKVEESEQMGRYVSVSARLGPGSCVLIEKPFCAVVVSSHTFKRCAKCLKDVTFTISPCLSCNKTLYCSDKCRTEAWEIFHKFECAIIDTIYAYLPYDHHLAIRVVLTVLHTFGTLEQWIEFTKDPNNSNQNAFQFDYTKTKKDEFRAICNLQTNESKRDVKDKIYYAVLTYALRTMLLDRTPLKRIVKTKKQRTFFTDRFCEILMMTECNSSWITLSNLRNNLTDEEIYGVGLYPSRALMSHSCAPNTMTAFRNDEMYVFVRRTIMEGKPVTVSYIWSFHKREKNARQTALKSKYQFDCNCEACLKNFPQLQLARRRAYARAFL